MLKQKIIKILPLWGIGLGLVILLVGGSGLIEQNKSMNVAQAQATSPEPQVLGDSIDLRGAQVASTTQAVLKPTFDDSLVTAKSYLVADAGTGSVITQKNADKKEYVASLTKLLTGLVAYEGVDINATAILTSADQFNVSPVLGLRSGDSIKLLDLFNAMLVGSNNDAALALANHVESITGQNFVDAMNLQAQNLGMVDSHFSNPLGFDSPGNYSTAQDLLKLVLATQKFSAFTSLGQKTGYQFTDDNGRTFKTKATDKLIADHPEIQAIKTGYTQGAGQAMITKDAQDGHSVYIIVLDSQDRAAAHWSLKSKFLEILILW